MHHGTKQKEQQRSLYDDHLLDDLEAGSGTFGFRKPKLIRDLFFAAWLRRLGLRKGDSVLDVGCNAGARLEQLRREFGTIGTGIDYSPKTVALGAQAFPELKLLVGDAEQLPFPDQSFDAVISFETFEHLPDPEAALCEMARVLKPGGRMLVYAISRQNFFTWHWWQYVLTGGRLGIGALGDHLPEYLVPPGSLLRWGKRVGLRQQMVQYFHSFFMLLYDEVVVAGLSSLLLRLRPKGKQERQALTSNDADGPQVPGRRFVWYRYWLYGVTAITYLLDTPWRLMHWSDGIAVLWERPASPIVKKEVIIEQVTSESKGAA